jgi:hypothetical protein
MENKDDRDLTVCETLRTMGLDFDRDNNGFITVDGDRWLAWWFEEEPDVIRLTFSKTVRVDYAADMAIRFARPLQAAGFSVVVS